MYGRDRTGERIMARYIKTDSSEAGNGIDHADTEGHVLSEDTDLPRKRVIDDADTEGHKRRDLTEADPGDLVDHSDTEGHKRRD
jgi:hypothetical protein